MARIPIFVLAAFFIGLLPGVARSGEPPAPKPEKPAEPQAPVYVLKQVQEMNGDKAARPPTTFRAGHVKPRKLPASALQRTKTGYSIRLPSGAPIATPTVVGGRLFVSGGFHSKEFYCFDAEIANPRLWACLSEQTEIVLSLNSQIPNPVTIAIKNTGKLDPLKTIFNVIHIRSNHCPVKHLPTGQIRIEINVRSQDEVLVVAIRSLPE